jgi:hypothetical protein
MHVFRAARALVLVLPALAALGLASGCETTEIFQGDPNEATPSAGDMQVTEPLAADSVEDVWDRAKATLDLMGFAIDEERTHYEDREIVTKWMTHLSPFRFEGYRRRAHVKIEPSGQKWVVKSAVLLQRNADIDNPQSPAQAQWEKHGIDKSRSALLNHRIRTAFDPEAGGVLAVPDEKASK